jgi:hypothetical protein
MRDVTCWTAPSDAMYVLLCASEMCCREGTFLQTICIAPHLQTYTQTSLGLQNTTVGNHIHVQHRNTRMLPVEGSVHDTGRTMVCAEYGNTEGSPNPKSAVTATITASASACTQMN